MFLVDQTDYYTMSPVDVQAKLDEFQSSTFDAIAFLPYRSAPADWLLPYTSGKPLIPWQITHAAFAWPGGIFDYDGSLGKLALFLADLENTIRVAQEIGSSGIALDLEFYQNYAWGLMAQAAVLAGISEAEYAIALQSIGTQIANIINETFPTATIWGIQCSISPSRNDRSDYWITKGILAALLPTVTFIASGEGEMQYYHTTASLYTDYANQFIATTTAVVQNDTNNVHLGAPMIIWQNKNDTGIYLATWIAANPTQPFSVLEDFRPVVNTLVNKFKYIWFLNCSLVTGWDSVGAEAVPVNAFLQSVKNGQPS